MLPKKLKYGKELHDVVTSSLLQPHSQFDMQPESLGFTIEEEKACGSLSEFSSRLRHCLLHLGYQAFARTACQLTVLSDER